MELFAHRAPWYVAGPLMGILIVGLVAVYSSAFSPRAPARSAQRRAP
jgi:hypothetical protein